MADGQKFSDLCDLYEASVRRFSGRPLFGVRESRLACALSLVRGADPD